MKLIYGFVNVTGLLLTQRFGERGVDEQRTLQELALRFAV